MIFVIIVVKTLSKKGKFTICWFSGRLKGLAAPCYAGGRRGGILPNLLFFKRKIVRLGRKMDHISANLAFWGYKKLQRGKKPIRKTEKKVVTFFLFLRQQGTPNGNVTPLGSIRGRLQRTSGKWGGGWF